MADLLVKLYDLPDERSYLERLAANNIIIRRGRAWEKHQVGAWVELTFGKSWASECEVAFSGQPVTCFLALQDGAIVGFACYDCTMKNFFGPMGIASRIRSKGIGRVLLLKCLQDMSVAGYGYAIVGDAGSPDFYKKTVNAQVIPDSSPGIYHNRLQDD